MFADSRCADGSAAIARFGEARLSRSRPHAQAEPHNVALGLEVRLAEPLLLTAPWDGIVTPTDDGFVLRCRRAHAPRGRMPHGARRGLRGRSR